MPISPEHGNIKNSIAGIATLTALVGATAAYQEYDSSTVASVDLVAEVKAEERLRRNIRMQQAGALIADRLFRERASRSADTVVAVADTTTTVATTTTIAPAASTTAPPTIQADIVPSYPVGCELYKPLVQNYDWPVDQAMLVMSEESGCNPNKVSPTNDYGLMQLHNEPIFEPEANIRRGYEKWVAGRVGERNFSAWYAVCTRGNNPRPKFPGVICQ